ncbi:6-phosphofructo-2-kinase/fructose-2,6-bisphosphatase protein [Spatholobus suberectus]|nr:6-phosphofructo-2-kinase/fructose-2,6-bisphosphatase protein [Spatholobus suberectus]
MERESASVWELSFVVPPNHEALEFKFLLKPKDINMPCFVEEGPSRENFRLSAVRGIPDVSINSELQTGSENISSASLELDLEHYIVPSPSISASSALVYAANLAEDPRSLGSGSASISSSTGDGSVPLINQPATVYQSPGMVKSQSVGTISPLQREDDQRGLLVDRGVGSPRLVKSSSSNTFTNLNLDTDTKNSIPAAAGAVAAAAIADQILGPKEHRHWRLSCLPARGKTYTAAKLTRYLRWLGHNTKHFNVGKVVHILDSFFSSADFFRADNPEGMEARNEVGIFDATNSSKQRRNMLMKLAEDHFLETICNDVDIIERNIRFKIQQSPDYAEIRFEAGLRDFKERVANYEKASLSDVLLNFNGYLSRRRILLKMIDMASGHGGQIQVNNISGYLPGRTVFFLVNTHLTPRPILLTRHGESQDNVRGRIGGDSALSEAGELYKKKLAKFVEKRLKSERAACIWTSTLQRTILTAGPIVGFPKIQWRALDEINAGVCDGMTYEEIKKNMPEEYESRNKDKLRYRYPRGESYLDVIQRLEPVIIELERQRAPVVVISHQAVLRALYAYFTDRPLKEIADIEVPLHTIIEIHLGVTGVEEKRYKLMD